MLFPIKYNLTLLFSYWATEFNAQLYNRAEIYFFCFGASMRFRRPMEFNIK